MAQKEILYKLNEKNEIITKNSTNSPTSSIGCKLFEKMKANKPHIAQIQTETGEEETYASLLERCIRTALHMRSRGINPGDIFSLCTNNTLDSCVPFIAGQFLGAVSASLDPILSPEEMDHLINLTKPKLIFTIPQSLQLIEQVVKTCHIQTEIIVFDKNYNNTSSSVSFSDYSLFSQFVEPIEGESCFKPLEITDLKTTAIIHFSSGSTGLPKGICISHVSVLLQVDELNHVDDLDYKYMENVRRKALFPIRILSMSPFYWISGSLSLIRRILNGFCSLLCLEFKPRKMWITIEKYKPYLVMLRSYLVFEMIAIGRPANLNLTSWFTLLITGSTLSQESVKKIKNIIPEIDTVMINYGQSETTGTITCFQPQSFHHRILMKNKPNSCGLPIRGITYRVKHTETNETLGPNQSGELQIKSNLIMNGYYQMDSSKSFTEDGWFKTGDLVYFDEEFCFYVIDRIKACFKFRGFFVIPEVIERELLQHFAVKQCVVLGIQQDDGDNYPMGVVVLKEEFASEAEMAGEIEKFVEERVSEKERLRAGVTFIKEMPLSVTGKIKKEEVRKMFNNKKLKL